MSEQCRQEKGHFDGASFAFAAILGGFACIVCWNVGASVRETRIMREARERGFLENRWEPAADKYVEVWIAPIEVPK